MRKDPRMGRPGGYGLKLTAHTDGASRGNPGPSAYGFTIEKDGAVIEDGGDYIGETTNNIAEYRAFVAALERMKELGASEVVVYSDSELAVRQINGVYRVRNAGLMPLFARVKDLLEEFRSWKVVHVTRDKNSLADGLANKALDRHLKSRK